MDEYNVSNNFNLKSQMERLNNLEEKINDSSIIDLYDTSNSIASDQFLSETIDQFSYENTNQLSSKNVDQYSSESDWSDITWTENNKRGKKTYTFKTADGTTITVDNLVNPDTNQEIKVKQNPKTGEIIVIGANQASIKGSNNGVKINIIDSSISDIALGKGDDNIVVHNSTIKSLLSGSGDDIIQAYDASINEINSDSGDDSIYLFNSTVNKDVNSGSGNDKIIIENSTVEKDINAGKDDDFINIQNSYIKGSVLGNNGQDDILINNSEVKSVQGNKGDDVILSNNSKISDSVEGNDGNDVLKLVNSETKILNAGKGYDSLIINNSNVPTIKYDKNDVVYKDTDVKSSSPLEGIDETSLEQADSIIENKISKYTNQNLLPEEQLQITILDSLTNNFENIKDQYEKALKKEGCVSDCYNFIKELLDMGVSRQDIEAAIKEQEQMLNELKSTFNPGSEKTFNEVYKKWTGVDFNEENITKYLESEQIYNVATTGIYKTQMFQNSVENADNIQEVFDYYTNYFGDKEKAREELNKVFATQYALDDKLKNPDGSYHLLTDCETYRINENYELEIIIPDRRCGSETWEGSVKTVPLSEQTNFLPKKKSAFEEIFKQYTDNYISNFEAVAGKSLQEIQLDYKTNQINACGCNNSFQKLIDRYCEDQEGFADKFSFAVQSAGLGLMVIGGVVTFVCPPAGVTLMQVGKYTAITGMFSDNALKLLDGISADEKMSGQEALDLVKETAIELALYYSGQKINGVAKNVQDRVLTATQSKTLAFLSEIGTDATLSLMTNYLITGDPDLTGEGISQLLGIITGIAGAKVNAYYKESFETANTYFKNNDPDGAFDFLKSKGISDKKIFATYANAELIKLAEDFKLNGDYDSVSNQINSSKILNCDTKAAKQTLDEYCTQIEKEYVAKMIYDGADTDTVYKYINNSKLLTDADKAYFEKYISGTDLINRLYKQGIDYRKYKDVNFNTEQGSMIKNDLQLVEKAKLEGKNINDLMVPKISDVDAELSTLKIGDIFEVSGENKIYIKTSDNNYTMLNMSKEKYCELFPAVDRYTSSQGRSGDCYLVSALNSLMCNPEQRVKLLSCIKENADGSITVKLPNSYSDITIKPGEDITSLGVQSSKSVSGPLGMQLLEYAYKVEYYSKENPTEIQKVNKNISSYDKDISQQWEKYKSDYQDMYDCRTEEDMRIISNEKLQEFKKNFKEDITADQMMALNIYLYGRAITPEQASKGIKSILGTDDINKINELKEFYNNNSLFFDNFTNILKIDEYRDSIANMADQQIEFDFENVEKQAGNGGYSSDVFRRFGLNAATNSVNYIYDIIEHPDLYSNRIFTAGTAKTKQDYIELYNDKNSKLYDYWHTPAGEIEYKRLLANAPENIHPNLVSRHAYSLEIKYENNIPYVIVTNPWGADASKPQMVKLTIEEFQKYFSNIYMGW